LRRDRRTSKLPESKAIAVVADAPSISGAATGVARTKLAAPISNKLKPINLDTIPPLISVWRDAACVYFFRRARKTSNPPESRTNADTAEAPSISGAIASAPNAKLAAPTNNKLKPISLDMISPSI